MTAPEPNTLGAFNSIAGVIAARVLTGLALFYGVQKFFKEVEGKLAPETKRSIAAWLLNLKTSGRVRGWRDTFPEIFDRFFGSKHLTWVCFARSSFMSAFIALSVAILTLGVKAVRMVGSPFMVVVMLCSNVVPDYISLLKTRRLVKASQNRSILGGLPLLALDVCGSYLCAVLAYELGYAVLITLARSAALWGKLTHNLTVLMWVLGFGLKMTIIYALVSPRYLWLYPAFWVSIWLLLYMCSGFLLKAATGFDTGLRWVGRTLDIEAKPLQSIGLLSGVIVALVYWGSVLIGFAIHKV